MRVLFWLLLTPFAAIAAGEELTTRDIIRRAEEAASEKVRESWEKFQTDIQAPLDQARKELNDAITKLNADKRFTDAQAVQKALADLEKTVMSKTVSIVIQPGPKPQPVKPEPVKPEPVPPQKPLLDRLAGKWTHPTATLMYYFGQDGSFHEDDKVDGRVNATGRGVLITKDIAEFKLSNGFKIHARMASDDVAALLIWGPAGNPVPGLVLQRQDPIIGRWQGFAGGVKEFLANGEIRDLPSCSWQRPNPAQRSYVFSWNDGRSRDDLVLSPDGNVLEGKNKEGQVIRAQRIQ